MATVAPQSYYSAAEACYALSRDFQTTINPALNVVSWQTSGMAGGYQAVKDWSRAYDERAMAFAETATQFVNATQHLGDILAVAGYNWEYAQWRANRDPNKGAGPDYPYDIPSQVPYDGFNVVGAAVSAHNGPGLETDVDGLYAKTIALVPGGELPDGNIAKLELAAQTWKSLADNETIAGAQFRLKMVAEGLSSYKAPDVPHLTEHLMTLSTSAGKIKLAANDLSASTNAHYSALNQLYISEQQAAMTTLGVATIVAIGITVLTRGRATGGAARIEATAIDACAASIAACIPPFLATLGGITFSAEALTAAGLGAILGLMIAKIESDESSPTSADDAPPFPPPKKINGYTDHGRGRVEKGRDGHGVSDRAMEEAVANPIKPPVYRPDNQGGAYAYEGKDAVVVLNEAGEVVSTWPKNRNGWRNP